MPHHGGGAPTRARPCSSRNAPNAVKLPYADLAIVSDAKVVEYLLNPEHPQGRGKAAFFFALGYRREQPDLLRDALLELARQSMSPKRRARLDASSRAKVNS